MVLTKVVVVCLYASLCLLLDMCSRAGWTSSVAELIQDILPDPSPLPQAPTLSPSAADGKGGGDVEGSTQMTTVAIL